VPSPALELLPAVDVSDGTAVRLVQGVAGSETSYGDPLEAALTWQQAGRALDPPRRPRRSLRSRQQRAAARGGGGPPRRGRRALRRHPRRRVAGAALATGCRRVNLGTAALEDPVWCAKALAEHGDRIAVGLDVRGRTLAARGWTQDGGDLFEVLDRLERDGCSRYVLTDVTKDGTLQGPNLELLRTVCAATDRPVVASGGISSLDDLRALARLTDVGVEGAIVGKALYAGAFTLQEALRAVQPPDTDGAA
jgi:phosphoribosylanthranilate isomerase